MDLTIIKTAMGYLDPRKGITMFAKWWLKTDDKNLELKQQKFELERLKVNMQSKTYCPRCKLHSMHEISRSPSIVDYKCNTSGCNYQQSYQEASNTPMKISENAFRNY